MLWKLKVFTLWMFRVMSWLIMQVSLIGMAFGMNELWITLLGSIGIEFVMGFYITYEWDGFILRSRQDIGVD